MPKNQFHIQTDGCKKVKDVLTLCLKLCNLIPYCYLFWGNLIFTIFMITKNGEIKVP